MNQPHLTTVVVMSCFLCTIACGPTTVLQSSAPPPVPVTVGQVACKTVPISFRAIGHIEPIETVAVKARIGGELQAVHFAEGTTVKAGQTLFTIDPRPYQAALAQTEAGMARNRALLNKAEADVTRYAGLVEQDFVTREQFDQITANAAALRAAVTADEANIDTSRLNLQYCTITAPISGRTGSLAVKVGALVKNNDDKAMVTIHRIRPIYASFSVPAQLLPQIQAHRDAGIKVLATLPFDGATAAEGQLTFVDNAVDTATSTILLKATFSNQDERLWPGQFVDLTVIVGSETDRVVCPAAAIQSGQQGQYVFVVRGDGTVAQKTVTVERADEVEAVIRDGLAAGDTVVTDGQLRLVDGSAITIKDAVGSSESAS